MKTSAPLIFAMALAATSANSQAATVSLSHLECQTFTGGLQPGPSVYFSVDLQPEPTPVPSDTQVFLAIDGNTLEFSAPISKWIGEPGTRIAGITSYDIGQFGDDYYVSISMKTNGYVGLGSIYINGQKTHMKCVAY